MVHLDPTKLIQHAREVVSKALGDDMEIIHLTSKRLREWLALARKHKKPSLTDHIEESLTAEDKEEALDMLRKLILKYQDGMKPGLASQHIYVLLKKFPGLTSFMKLNVGSQDGPLEDKHETGWTAVDTFMGVDFHIAKQTYSSAIKRFENARSKGEKRAVQNICDDVEKDIRDILQHNDNS